MKVGTAVRFVGADWFNLLLGMWLVISPFVLGFGRSTAALCSNIVMGAAVMVLAWISGSKREAVQALFVPSGMWIFLSPFVLDFLNKGFVTNNLVIAFLVIAGGAASEMMHTAAASGGSAHL